ncbi:MAG: hypothetical protein KAW14_11820 [Candidatus Aegiribacteria sp.]|nr:hypothetical protein [Candidatus Aegiribacteria sp.]
MAENALYTLGENGYGTLAVSSRGNIGRKLTEEVDRVVELKVTAEGDSTQACFGTRTDCLTTGGGLTGEN